MNVSRRAGGLDTLEIDYKVILMSPELPILQFLSRTVLTKILAVTEEARSGDWNALKGPLTEFGRSGINAAAVWYARTDGSYYTVEKGLTDQNISDRPYFPRLMGGGNVIGDLIISKSTGKRSAVTRRHNQRKRRKETIPWQHI
jgi:hypothetical protein